MNCQVLHDYLDQNTKCLSNSLAIEADAGSNIWMDGTLLLLLMIVV